jgi:hypothetical protein
VRRRLSWLGVLLGAALLISGVLVAAFGLNRAASPAGVVGDYFAALTRGDAQRALAYGELPAGPREFLTDEVLAEQQRIAPLHEVAVTITSQDDRRARASVRYTMNFATGALATTAVITLHRSGDDWRLDETAVATEIEPSTAAQRLSILGSPLPTGRILLFPGALPVRVDTPFLELVPSLDYVRFGTARPAELPVRISDRGEAAVVAAVRTQLHRCLTGRADPACPLPSERYVPGSVHGRVVSELGGLVDLDEADPAGLLRYSGRPTIKGSWQRLDYHNVARHQAGQILLDAHAVGYATAPLRLHWTRG